MNEWMHEWKIVYHFTSTTAITKTVTVINITKTNSSFHALDSKSIPIFSYFSNFPGGIDFESIVHEKKENKQNKKKKKPQKKIRNQLISYHTNSYNHLQLIIHPSILPN
jgi:hypothetical protein